MAEPTHKAVADKLHGRHEAPLRMPLNPAFFGKEIAQHDIQKGLSALPSPSLHHYHREPRGG